MATWPNTLPAAQIPGYSLRATDATVRTDMDSGPVRVRRRFTATPDHLTLRFVMSETQMAAFRTFWDGDAQQGAAWFYLPIKDGRSAGVTSKEVRPTGGTFKADLLSTDYWAVSLDVEVRNA